MEKQDQPSFSSFSAFLVEWPTDPSSIFARHAGSTPSLPTNFPFVPRPFRPPPLSPMDPFPYISSDLRHSFFHIAFSFPLTLPPLSLCLVQRWPLQSLSLARRAAETSSPFSRFREPRGKSLDRPLACCCFGHGSVVGTVRRQAALSRKAGDSLIALRPHRPKTPSSLSPSPLLLLLSWPLDWLKSCSYKPAVPSPRLSPLPLAPPASCSSSPNSRQTVS